MLSSLFETYTCIKVQRILLSSFLILFMSHPSNLVSSIYDLCADLLRADLSRYIVHLTWLSLRPFVCPLRYDRICMYILGLLVYYIIYIISIAIQISGDGFSTTDSFVWNPVLLFQFQTQENLKRMVQLKKERDEFLREQQKKAPHLSLYLQSFSALEALDDSIEDD